MKIDRRQALKLIGQGAIVAGMSPYLIGCQKEQGPMPQPPQPKGYDFKLKKLEQGLVTPGGLSVLKNSKKSGKRFKYLTSIFFKPSPKTFLPVSLILKVARLGVKINPAFFKYDLAQPTRL